jgi:hypothetical protein
MEFKEDYKKAHPETIGEKDQDFDRANYIDWLDEKHKELMGSNKELLEALQGLVSAEPLLLYKGDVKPEHEGETIAVFRALAKAKQAINKALTND